MMFFRNGLIVVICLYFSNDKLLSQVDSIPLKNEVFNKYVSFENKNAIFYLNVEEIKDSINTWKNESSKKYSANLSEVDLIMSADTLQNDTLKLTNSSIMEYRVTKYMLEHKLRSGSVSIWDKKKQSKVRAIKIRNIHGSHADKFIVYNADYPRAVLFESLKITVSN